jgi:hypothetical protein
MECPRLPASVCLDAGELHHLAPLLGFCGDKMAKISGRAGKWFTAQVGKPRPDRGIGEDRIDLFVKPVDDFAGGAPWSANTQPSPNL